jgi:CRISPR system Cascade subunit CasC
MIIELHAIQSFAPANLNRDDQGAPKDCTFGGVPRARVSSQSWKRAMRVAFRQAPEAIETGTRTKRAQRAIVDRITALDPTVERDVARRRAAVLLEGEPLGLTLKHDEGEDEVKTGQLVFFRSRDLDTLAELAVERGDALDGLTPKSATERGKKDAPRPVLPKEVATVVKRAMTSPGAALDVALFGRLVAELPEASVDAACQVAHAVGTHRIAYEGDYYTAVDDLKPEDTEGADMIGEIQFNASCLYRYAAVDVEQLVHNLGVGSEPGQVTTALAAFSRAFVTTVPSGKQTTFAARNLPTAVLAVRRNTGAANLINAFVAPVTATEAGGIPSASVVRMLREYATLEDMYGVRDGSTTAALLTSVDGCDGPWERVAHIDDVVAHASHV